MGWRPGCFLCKNGCKGIPIFCLANLSQILCCAKYEESDGASNRSKKGISSKNAVASASDPAMSLTKEQVEARQNSIPVPLGPSASEEKRGS
jgi:hypothetical protein